MYYIIASHGTYAQGCKSSCEMITGSAPLFVAVTFTEDMTKEALENEYERILAEKGPQECTAIIADLPGGTPYNAAMKIAAKHQNIRLVSGLCQQLLVLLNMGESLEEAFKHTGEIFRDTSWEKEEKEEKEKKDKKEEKGMALEERGTKKPELNGSTSREPVEKNGIVNFRLDERLIHGQVATYWTRTLQADRIMVADDDVLKDEIGMDALKAAVPSGVHLSILSVDNAARRLNAGAYSGQRVFLIVNKTGTVRRLLDAGVNVKEVNIGNMGQKEGRSQIKKSVYCTAQELDDIRRIEEDGTLVYAQMVPNDEKRAFSSYVKE